MRITLTECSTCRFRITDYSVAVLLILALVSFTAFADSKTQTKVIAGEVKFKVREAITREEKRTGLMHIKSLKDDAGLLMIFNSPRQVPIWMKNVHIGLDVVWLSKDGLIIEKQTLQPCKSEPCPISMPEYPVSYVLEVNAGKFTLNIGDKVEIISGNGDSLHPKNSN